MRAEEGHRMGGPFKHSDEDKFPAKARDLKEVSHIPDLTDMPAPHASRPVTP